MITLYQIDNNKRLRTWSIQADHHTITISYGLFDGAKVTNEEAITKGLAGRSIEAQILSRINSRVNRQVSRGYRYSIEEAEESAGCNEMNFIKPMLAQQFDKASPKDTTGAVLQRKLDGNRMLATRKDGKIICYTRNGKPIESVDHIIEQLDWLEEGQTLDGELYVHGMALRDINSRIRRKQEGTKELNYHIYDSVEDLDFVSRFRKLTNIAQVTEASNIVLEPYWYVVDDVQTKALFNTIRSQGYEGLMMRLHNSGYEPGKRSSNLLKLKVRQDAEFKVIDVEVGKDGSGILVLQISPDVIAKGVAPGTREDKQHAAKWPADYVGRLCTCSFAYLTDFGVPFHLTCDRWRDDD